MIINDGYRVISRESCEFIDGSSRSRGFLCVYEKRRSIELSRICMIMYKYKMFKIRRSL